MTDADSTVRAMCASSPDPAGLASENIPVRYPGRMS
jgi:hypothetical protein